MIFLAHILLSRKQPNNEFIIGVFLVDIYCLGLKNAFCNANIPLEEYEKLKLKMAEESSLINLDYHGLLSANHLRQIFPIMSNSAKMGSHCI